MNTEELTKLITEYGKDIYNFCLHLAMSRTEADELYQDVFLTVINKIDEGGNPKSFLMGTAMRLWRNKRRKEAWRLRIAPKEELAEESEFPSHITPEGEYLKKEERQSVLKAINSLKEPLRQTVILYYSSELTVEKTAEIMGVPTGTVKSRLYKARKILKQLLEADING